jgi:hypothetical protein
MNNIINTTVGMIIDTSEATRCLSNEFPPPQKYYSAPDFKTFKENSPKKVYEMCIQTRVLMGKNGLRNFADIITWPLDWDDLFDFFEKEKFLMSLHDKNIVFLLRLENGQEISQKVNIKIVQRVDHKPTDEKQKESTFIMTGYFLAADNDFWKDYKDHFPSEEKIFIAEYSVPSKKGFFVF